MYRDPLSSGEIYARCVVFFLCAQLRPVILFCFQREMEKAQTGFREVI